MHPRTTGGIPGFTLGLGDEAPTLDDTRGGTRGPFGQGTARALAQNARGVDFRGFSQGPELRRRLYV